jgi:hypothetical protein
MASGPSPELLKDAIPAFKMASEAIHNTAAAFRALFTTQDGVWKLFGTLTAAAPAFGAAIGAATVAIIAMKSNFKDVIEDERSLIALQANFTKSNGELSDSYAAISKQIDNLASAQPFVDDGQLRASAALLKSLGATEEQISGLLPAATALSIIYGKDLGETTQQLANGIVGSTKGLREFGIVLDGNATDTERYNAIMEKARLANEQLAMFNRDTASAMDGASLSQQGLTMALVKFGEQWGYSMAGPVKIINVILQKITELGTLLLATGPVVGAFFQSFTDFKNFNKIMAEPLSRLEEARKALATEPVRNIKLNIPGVPDSKKGLTPDGKEPPGKEPPGLKPPKPTPPPKPAPAPKPEFDFLSEFNKRVSIKNLYGVSGLGAMQDALAETDKAAKAAGAKGTATGRREALGRIAGEKIGELGKLRLDQDRIGLMQDPMERLKATIDSFPFEMQRANEQLGTAVTGDQKQAAAENIANLKLENQRNKADYGRMVVDKNTALLSGMASVFSDFINAFGDQIGRAAAGGEAMSAGGTIRGAAGVASGALGIAGGLMPLGSMIGGLAAGPVLAAVGVVVSGIASIFAGFFDQQDENAKAALAKQEEQLRVQSEQNKNLGVLANASKDARVKAGSALGTVTAGEAALAAVLSPFSGAAAEGMGTALGASGFGRTYTYSGGKTARPKETPFAGATLGKDQQALIDYFGKPENKGKLKDVATQLNNGANLGVVLGGMNIPGMEGRREGQFGTDEQMQQTGNMLLNLFSTLDDFYKTQAQRELDVELQKLGSTPRNPVYIYDITPADQRFTFQPREAFFRAGMRQSGSNVTPGVSTAIQGV